MRLILKDYYGLEVGEKEEKDAFGEMQGLNGLIGNLSIRFKL